MENDFVNYLSESVKIAIRIAKSIAREYANECYTPSHLLKALMHKEIGLQGFIQSLGKIPDILRIGQRCVLKKYPVRGKLRKLRQTSK